MVKSLLTVQETRVQSLDQEDPQKEMATHSRTLAWKIPWTEEPGGLQSVGPQRVGHAWASSLSFSLPECGHPAAAGDFRSEGEGGRRRSPEHAVSGWGLCGMTARLWTQQRERRLPAVTLARLCSWASWEGVGHWPEAEEMQEMRGWALTRPGTRWPDSAFRAPQAVCFPSSFPSFPLLCSRTPLSPLFSFLACLFVLLYLFSNFIPNKNFRHKWTISFSCNCSLMGCVLLIHSSVE